MTAVYALGSLTFPTSQQPTEGSQEDAQPQEWVEFKPIGASAPGTLLTYLSSPSIEQSLTAYLTTANKDTMKSLYAARAQVTWTTPDDGTGYPVIITKLSCIKDRSTRGTGRWKVTWTMVKQS